MRAVIFDVDGTLIDSVDMHAAAWQRSFAHFGHDRPFDRIRAQIGKGGDQLLPVFLSEDEVRREGEAIEAFRSDLFAREYLPRAGVFPAVRELFLRVRQSGARAALASSGKPDEVRHYERLAGIEDLVEARTSSGDAERSKPFPDIFAAALDRLGDLPPAAAVVVGDSPWDAEAASRLGLRAVGLLCGGFAEVDLRSAGCVAIFRDPADLAARFAESPLAAGGGEAP